MKSHKTRFLFSLLFYWVLQLNEFSQNDILVTKNFIIDALSCLLLTFFSTHKLILLHNHHNVSGSLKVE